MIYKTLKSNMLKLQKEQQYLKKQDHITVNKTKK